MPIFNLNSSSNEDNGLNVLDYSKSGNIHSLIGLNNVNTEQNDLILVAFNATADYNEGDTFTIDSDSYTAQQENGEELPDKQFTTGSSVTCLINIKDKIINFKGRAGVSNSDLALATAIESYVFNGKTFYAGDSKEIKTGTALSTVTDVAASNLFNGKKAYDNNGNLITGTALNQSVNVNANNLPSGITAYNQSGQKITGNGSTVFKYETGSCFLNGSSEYINCNFTIKVLALYGGSWLSDCVQIGNGSTTFYKCPDSDFMDQENYQGTITVSGRSATIWYNPGDGCSIYYVACGA